MYVSFYLENLIDQWNLVCLGSLTCSCVSLLFAWDGNIEIWWKYTYSASPACKKVCWYCVNPWEQTSLLKLLKWDDLAFQSETAINKLIQLCFKILLSVGWEKLEWSNLVFHWSIFVVINWRAVFWVFFQEHAKNRRGSLVNNAKNSVAKVQCLFFLYQKSHLQKLGWLLFWILLCLYIILKN